MAYYSPVELPKNIPTIVFASGSLDNGIGEKKFGVGGYGEDRADVYKGLTTHEGRTVHMGDDLFVPVGSSVFSVADGKILSFTDNAEPGDYGPTLIVEHQLDNGETIYALYGHLSRETLDGKKPGQPVRGGEKIGEVGDRSVNGGWAPHVHLQLSRVKPGVCDMPGVLSPSDFVEMKQTYPDPRAILGKIY